MNFYTRFLGEKTQKRINKNIQRVFEAGERKKSEGKGGTHR